MSEVPKTPERNRRDVVLVSAAAFAGMGGLLALWPFVAALDPTAADVPRTLDVDILAIAPGASRLLQWQGRPILVRHRTPDENAIARAADATERRDPFARNERLPADARATDANRTSVGRPQWLLVVAICTKDACIVRTEGAILAHGEAFACPCCNARYDLSGRVVSGPAPTNLAVPRYTFVSETLIRLS